MIPPLLNEFILSKPIKIKLQDKEKLKKDLKEHHTVQQELEFSNGTMSKFYDAAYHILENKNYEDAFDAFLFLTTLSPYYYDYWIGLGISAQFSGHYEEAIDAYEMGAILESENPIPYFYLAKCLFAIHEKDNAIQALDMAIEYAGEKSEFFDLKQEALTARKLLSKDHEE